MAHVVRRHPKEQLAGVDGELDLRRAEVEDMIEAIKKARENRDALSAQAGRSSARESISAADELFDKVGEGAVDSRHGLLFLAITQILKAIPEIAEGVEKLQHGHEA